MFRNTARFALLSVSALLTLAPTASLAIGSGRDGKMYPAAFCQQAGTSQQLLYYHGRAINTSTAPRVADCPMLTDAPFGMWLGRALVYAIDRHYSQDIYCSIIVYDHLSSSISYTWSQRRTHGSSSAVQTLEWEPSSSLGGRPWAPMLLGCSVPGTYSGNRSELISYHIYEYERNEWGSNK